ncbi:hypothetical protein P168DRAFT_292164 [Aspergillus campestris IBT 28561]|uniref:Acyltransferase 3 domain-containing protein n=1 Tax=Aspergillus campestris (strain IBT 28561) TaxID=1392248 RepID=A0A2I1CWQ2_ASPC2|nr:uncharacterized protein P168DRAFT_292164 [Aspergillus campestris IBT 28561]PKY02050.1 hypothetical protein P168DRAFT_292164 [Aspergillus campestris IBT 28561]
MALPHQGSRASPPIQDIPLHDIEAPRDQDSPYYYSRSRSARNHSPGVSEKLDDFFDDWQTHIDRAFTNFLVALTPSFWQHLVGGQPPEAGRLHAIAALDGLRGWACLLVFNFHFLFTYTWKVAVGWGFNGENYSLWQLPILHMVVSGHIMVAIFFVISGYVLSYKPIKTIRSRMFDQTFLTLASSTFRRGLRLYVPAIVGLAAVFIAVRMGFYNYSFGVIKEGHTIQGTNEQHPELMELLYDQYWDWHLTIMTLMNPWNWALYYNYYNPHLWTIPVEFRCSIVLFLTILATSRAKTAVRLSLVSGLIWFCMRWGRWDVVLFLSGMLLAEADLINGTWERPPRPADGSDPDDGFTLPRSLQQLARYLASRKLWIGLFLVGLYLGSTPNTGCRWTPFYMWTYQVIPETYPEPHRFPQTIGAVLIVCSINHSKEIQKLFTNGLSQYLGKISFAFYIVHGPILHSLGYSLMPNIWSLTGKETNLQYCMGFLIGWSICLPISIWAADIFWRAVDIPSVKFARWVESQVMIKGPTPPPPNPNRSV